MPRTTICQRLKITGSLVLFAWLPGFVFSQTTSRLNGIMESVTRDAQTRALEKAYVHTDRSYYFVNDTLWFKAYVFSTTNLSASEKSGVLRLQVVDEQGLVIKDLLVALYHGVGRGAIPLPKKLFPAGSYQFRVYTNWMRNFVSHELFSRSFYIDDPDERKMLISPKFAIRKEQGKEKLSANLQLTDPRNRPLEFHNFDVSLVAGNERLRNIRTASSAGGALDVSFDLPSQSDPVLLKLTVKDLKDKEETALLPVPVILSRDTCTDLQFMPEGGYLVAGIRSRIAFKALAQDGYGARVTGILTDSKQQKILEFTSSHAGMGSFDLLPQSGERYDARIKYPDGSYSPVYPLPAVRQTGQHLRVVNSFESDSLIVYVSESADLNTSANGYYLIARSRGVACFGALLRLQGKERRIAISKDLLATGISRISLVDTTLKTLNERQVFIDHRDDLQVQLTFNQTVYGLRDSIGFEMRVTDESGKPVEASFSLSVTDDGQNHAKDREQGNLKSSLLLTSDLKGLVEDPGYYFPASPSALIWDQLDNLVLSQGWTNYDWPETGKPPRPLNYPAENQFNISGKVVDLFRKPVKNTTITLLSRKPFLVLETTSDQLGRFSFPNVYPSDTAQYFIQARNKNGKSFNVGVEPDEYQVPVFARVKHFPVPWYVNPAQEQLKVYSNLMELKTALDKLTGGIVLNEVAITGKRAIKGSHNLNKDGGSDYTIGLEAIAKLGKTSLGDVLRKSLKGLVERPNSYQLYDRRLEFIIDGVNLIYLYNPASSSYTQFIEQYFNFLTAEDLKSVEVMRSPVYVANYFQRYITTPPYAPTSEANQFAFVEITTYSGNGAFLQRQAGTSLFKPPAFAPVIQFYSPRYQGKPVAGIDHRSTVYWDPDLVTDAKGQVRAGFYSTDRRGTYSVVLEGVDMNGHLGVYQTKIRIE